MIDWRTVAAVRAESGHSLFGPSTLPRVRLCTGSVEFCVQNNAESKDSEAAREGTLAHALAQRCLEYEREAIHFARICGLPDKPFHYTDHGKHAEAVITEEMATHVQRYVDWVREVPGDHFIESRLSLTEDMPLVPVYDEFGELIRMEPLDQFGSSDHIAIYFDGEAWVLCVTDLKYGIEIVYALDNWQLLGYALASYREHSWAYPITKIRLRIAQPRLDHFDEVTIGVDELLQFAVDLKATIETAMSGLATLVAGEKQCRWCPMSGRCPTQQKMLNKLTAGEFEDFDKDEVGSVAALTGEQLEKALTFRNFVRNWLKSCESRMMEQAAIGATPNWKIVAGKSNRVLKDPEGARAYAMKHGVKKDQLYTVPKMLSPAGIENLLPKDAKKGLADFVAKPPGRPTLAAINDRRPAIALTGEFDEFEDEETEETDSTDSEE